MLRRILVISVGHSGVGYKTNRAFRRVSSRFALSATILLTTNEANCCQIPPHVPAFILFFVQVYRGNTVYQHPIEASLGMYKGRAALGRNPNCTVRTAGCQLVYSRWRILFPIVLLDGFWQFAPSVNATHAHVSPQRQTRSTSTLPTFPSSLSEKLHRLTNQMKSGSLRKQSRAFEQNTMLSKSDDLSTPAQNQSGGKHTGFNSFLAGGLAGSIATIVTSPIEVRPS